MDESLVQQFVTITGTSEEVARNLLEACNNDIQLAIEMQFESTGSEAREAYQNRACQSVAEGSSSLNPQCASVDVDDDPVRPPIPQQRAVLVDDPYHAIPYPRTRKRVARTVFDGFRDFQAETKQQEELLLKGAASAESSKINSLQDLFRPPVDITFKGTFEAARSQGEAEKKWILVNVQNVNEFVCQTLNRDVWRNEAVREIIKGHFILWQVYCDSDEGQRYMLYYPVKAYPHIAVIDPRTGERLVVWGSSSKMDSQLFCDLATLFLTEHPDLGDNSFEEDSEPDKKRPKTEIIDASEELQIKAAIAASLGSKDEVDLSKQKGSQNYESDSEDLETFSGSDDDIEEVASNSTKTALPFVQSKVSMHCAKFSTASNHKSTSPQKVDDRWKFKNSSTKDASKNIIVGQLENNTSPENAKKDQRLGLDHDSGESVPENSPRLNLMLRLPDGNRVPLTLSSHLTLKDLRNRINSLGYSEHQYELLSNFPRRNFSKMDRTTLLKDAGLYPQDTLFIQLK